MRAAMSGAMWTVSVTAVVSATLGTSAIAEAYAPPEVAVSQAPAPDPAALKAVCGSCHTLDLVVGRPRTEPDWVRVFDKMANLGLKGSDAEIAAAASYIRTNLMIVNVNSAPAADLAPVLGVSRMAAEAVVTRRERRLFADIPDLADALGVEAARLNERKDRIAFQ